MTDPTTARAEEIRETTGMAWERACLQAERERDGITRPMPDLKPGDIVLDNSGHVRRVVSFAPDNVACSQNHVSYPGSRVVYATWQGPVRWRNPEEGSPVWEHTLRYCVAMGG